MWIRYAPPGRSSLRSTVLLNPRGPHHLAMCSDCVHASKTSLRGASNTRSITSTRSAGSLTRFCAAPMCLLLCQRSGLKCSHVFGEMLERFGPSLARAARRVSFNRVGLMGRQPSLAAAEVGECHGGHHFVAVMFQRADPHDSLRRNDLAKDSVHPMVPAEPAHTKTELAAVAELHLARRHGEVVGREPARQVLGLRPSLEDETPRRVEDACDRQLAIAGGHFGVLACRSHCPCPACPS